MYLKINKGSKKLPLNYLALYALIIHKAFS